MTPLIRCADGLAGRCPFAAKCERTAPAEGLVSMAFYNGVRESLGWCPARMPIDERCTEDD